MLLSELLNIKPDEDVVEIKNEQPFDRFARTTSVTKGLVCVYVASRNFLSTIPDNAAMVITNPEIAESIANANFGICVSKDPKATYFRLFNVSAVLAEKQTCPTKVGKGCIISDSAIISNTNVVIEDDVVIEDSVIIYPNVKIDRGSIIRAGAKIGVQDYNFYKDGGDWIHLHHYGSLQIGKNVEIGYNSIIGIALYPGDETTIGDGTKIGHLTVIGHDDKIGKRVLIYDGCMLGGCVSIGDDTHVTLNSSIKNGLSLGENSQVDMASVVIRDIPDGQTVFGNPAKRMIVPKMQ